MTTQEKAAYVKGLAEGMDMLDDSKTGRFMTAIVELLTDLASDVEDLEDTVGAIEDELERIEEDIDDFGDFLFDVLEEDDDDDDDDDDVEDDECGCGSCSGCKWEADEEDDDSDCVLYDVTCGACGAEISVDESVIERGQFPCPKCGKLIEFSHED